MMLTFYKHQNMQEPSRESKSVNALKRALNWEDTQELGLRLLSQQHRRRRSL